MKKANLSEQAMISIIWSSLMGCVEWNKKEELVTEQAIKHLKVSSSTGSCFLFSPIRQELVKFVSLAAGSDTSGNVWISRPQMFVSVFFSQCSVQYSLGMT